MNTTLSVCRWNWCARTFSDHSSLRDHVEMDHIANATPIKRKDVSLLKFVEDGTGMPESFLSHVSISGIESSPQVSPPIYVQRGIMTDPMVPPESEPTEVVGSSPVHMPVASVDNEQLPMKFTELRGTPSPMPSPLPPSPGTSYLVKNIVYNTVSPVSLQRNSPPFPYAYDNDQKTTSVPQSTPKARDPMSCLAVASPVESDHADPHKANTAGAEEFSSQEMVEMQLMIINNADNLVEMGIDSIAFPELNSQWQPQSQLPMLSSLEDSSSLSSTINPVHLHVEDLSES